jgi:glycogen phosphorylase
MLAQYFENSYFPPTLVGKLPGSPLDRRRSSDVLIPEPALV